MTDDGPDDDLSIPGLGERDDDGDGREGLALGDDGIAGSDDSGGIAGGGNSGRSADAADDREDSHAGDEDDEEVEPVEVLVEMAREGEIDPWDIDIVTVTDEFLARIDEADLRTSGRALFYASVLLRMKGDELLSEGEDDPDEGAADPWEDRGVGLAAGDGETPEGFDPIEGLEDELERRLDRKRARGTPETLDELVHELREAEREHRWKDGREYDTAGGGGYRQGTQTLDYRADDDVRADEEPTEGEVTANTHGEDVEALVAAVHEELRRHYDAGREEVLFAEVRDAAGSTVETYLGLLFLSHRGHVALHQDELFGDLWIRDPAAPGGESKGIAD